MIKLAEFDYTFLVLIAFGAAIMIFSREIIEWRMRRANREGEVRQAIKGAIVHAPYDITGQVISVSNYKPDPKMLKIIIEDKNGIRHERIFDPNKHIKPYNIIDGLIDTKDQVFILNIDHAGKPVDHYMGIDFIPQSLDRLMGDLEARALSAEQRVRSHLTSPLDDHVFLERMELYGESTKRVQPPPPTDKIMKSPLIEMHTGKEDEEED